MSQKVTHLPEQLEVYLFNPLHLLDRRQLPKWVEQVTEPTFDNAFRSADNQPNALIFRDPQHLDHTAKLAEGDALVLHPNGTTVFVPADVFKAHYIASPHPHAIQRRQADLVRWFNTLPQYPGQTEWLQLIAIVAAPIHPLPTAMARLIDPAAWALADAQLAEWHKNNPDAKPEDVPPLDPELTERSLVIVSQLLALPVA